ncbi:ribbon-helix-helix domain-containing protein [Kitasatospora sp. P5_F3]
MALKRTTVYAESEDLAVIKAAAARRGIAEAEIIREAIHLAAMANRVWDEPFFTTTYPGTGSIGAEEVRAEQARAYEATKRGRE